MKELILPQHSGNTFTTTERVLKSGDEAKAKADHMLERAADAVKPSGSAYVGSGAFHMYRDLAQPDTYHFAVQTHVGAASEGQASMGISKLREALMKLWGRQERKRT